MYPTTNPIKTILFAASCSLLSAGCPDGDRFSTLEITSQEQLLDFVQNSRHINILGITGSVTDLDILQGSDVEINAVYIHDTNLTEIDWSYAVGTSQITVHDNSILQRISVSGDLLGLVTIEDNQSAFTVDILGGPSEKLVSINNNGVTTLSIPSMILGDVKIADNPNLCTLNLPALERFRGDGVQNNPCLPQEQVDAINALRAEDAPASEPNGPAPQPETPAPEGE